MRLDDPRLAALAAETAGCSAVVSFVEESADHRLFIAAALLEDGAVRHVQRKVLPAHLRPLRRAALLRRGRRDPGRRRRAWGSRSGSPSARTSGTSGRPRSWPSTGRRSWSTSRRRPGATWPPSHAEGLGHGRLVAHAPADLRAADHELRRLLQPGRRGRVDQLLGRQRGDRAGRASRWSRAPLYDEAPGLRGRGARRRAPGADRPAPPARRAPGAARRASWSGSWPSGRTWRRTRRPTPAADADGRPPVSDGRGRSPFELPRGAADRHRRRAARHRRFIRGQLRQAGFERAVLGLSGGHRLGARGLPRRGGDRRRAAALPADALPDLVAGLAGGRRGGRRAASAARAALVDISPMVDGYFGTEADGARAGRRRRGRARGLGAPAGQLHGPGPDDGPLRPLGDVGRAGRRAPATRPSRSSATRRSSATAPAPSTRSATSTRPRCASSRWPSACPTRSSRKAPSADLWPGQTDEAEAGFTYHELDRLLFWMIDRRRSADRARGARLRRGDRRAGRADGGRVGVQAPGAADGEARAAHGRRRLPLPAPAARQRPAVSAAAERADGAAEAAAAEPAAEGPAAGRLFVVATPIGNLGDVTLRALEVLRAVPLVAAEDTRLTRRLFARHGLATRLVSYHARNAAARGPELLAHLRGGADLALVTDAGTPLVRTPAASSSRAWAAEGGAVVPIPGPSAVLAALVASRDRRPALGVRGVPAALGPRAARRAWPGSRDDRARRSSSRRPGGSPRRSRDLAAACGAGPARRRLPRADEAPRGGAPRLARPSSPPRPPAGAIVARGEVVDRGRRRHGGVGAPGTAAPPRTDATARTALARARAEVERLVAGGRRPRRRRAARGRGHRDPASPPLRRRGGRVGSGHHVGDRPPPDPRRALPDRAGPRARDGRDLRRRPSSSTGARGGPDAHLRRRRRSRSWGSPGSSASRPSASAR